MTRTITFLSDFGPGSDYVGICHAVIARIAPQARVIDLGHGVPPGDLRAASHLLARSIPYTEPGVHLAVVDPGVGTERRALALGSADGRVFVGPDNGLLAFALAGCGGAEWAFEISESDYRVKPVSRTFWGRDVFSPVAAALAAGADPTAVGEEIDPGSIQAGAPRVVEPADGDLRTAVAWADEFGNLALDLRWSELVKSGLAGEHGLRGNALIVSSGRRRAIASVGEVAYADVEEGAMLVHPDSFGATEVAINGGSAADELQASSGTGVKISRRR